MSLRDALRRPARPGPAGDEAASPARTRGRILGSVAAVERELWLLVVATMAADVALTVYGRQIGLVEMNPVARLALDVAGTFGLVGLKSLALALGACCWWVVPGRYAPAVPLGLALPTTMAVVSNATLVTLVLL